MTVPNTLGDLAAGHPVLNFHHDENGHTVDIASNRLEDGGILSFRFTNEGVIIDLVDGGGDVAKTTSMMYDELAETLLQ